MSKQKEPDLISNGHGDEITFDKEVFENLPKFLKDIIDKFYEQNEKDIALLSALTAISGLSTNYYSIYDGRRIEPNLYSFIVAPFGSGKGVLGFIRNLLEATDIEKNNAYENALKKYMSEKSIGKADKPPKRKLILLPANTSKTQFIKILSENEGRVTIFETEADTLTTAMFSKHGDFGDVLRNGFQGEPTSYTRATDDILIKIDNTTIALIVSGTKGQVLRLIKDFTDGLASRIDFLSLITNPEFKDVFLEKDDTFLQWFRAQGVELAEMYSELQEMEENIYFSFTSKQMDAFKEHWANLKADYHEKYNGELNGIINRQALKCTKMAMILTLIRTYFDPSIKHLPNELLCSTEDFFCALSISTTLLDSNMKIAEEIAQNSNTNYLQKMHDQAALKEMVFGLWDEGVHSYAEIARRIGKTEDFRATILKWLKKGGRK